MTEQQLLDLGFTYKSYYSKETPQGTLIYSGVFGLKNGDNLKPISENDLHLYI